MAAVLLLASVATACNPVADKGAAEEALAGYFEAVRAKDFERALTFFGEDFFGETSREKQLANMQGVTAKLGDLQAYEQTGWKINTSTGVGTTFSANYKVTYSKYAADEQYVLLKEDDGFKILSWNVQSDGFLQ